MDINEYLVAAIVNERLQQARAEWSVAAVQRQRPARPSWRSRLGRALIALGQRLAGDAVPALALADLPRHRPRG